ncbi:MAG: hypothetical protein ACOH2N_10850 [Devosia sp.]
MRQIFCLIRDFGRDERGVFAVTFALMAIVLVALSGATVDYVSLQQMRNRGQIALDAATLALQPEIFKTPIDIADIKQRAQDLLLDRLGDEHGVTASLYDPKVDLANGTLTLEARMIVPTVFVALVGVETMNASILSEATRRLLAVEVAMVLDNSGSMRGSRMSNLKEAACNAVNILFYDEDGRGCNVPTGKTKSPNVKIGVVPFTAMVNIGTQFKNKAWLDWKSESQANLPGGIPNFDNDDDETTPFRGPMDRRTLFSETGTSWKGCIEARVSPYDTTDDPPDRTSRKFIPLFTPDTVHRSYDYLPDTGGTCQPKVCIEVKTEKNCSGGWGNWGNWGHWGDDDNDGGNGNCSTEYSYRKSVGGGTINMGSASCVPDNAVVVSSIESGSGSTVTTTTQYNLLSERELQDRLCKYDDTNERSSSTNYGCPGAELLPLTDYPKSVLDSIDAMEASGNTNIQQGAVWGMHALTSGEPLTGAKPAAPGQVSKVLIVMTDGENYPELTSDNDMNGSSYFSWGFRYDGRMGPHADVDSRNKVTTVMDERTVATCHYARTQRDIEVYTIGLGSNNATKAMLTSCAADSEHAYFPDNPEQLSDVFRSIAAKLAALRLSQ